MATRKPHGAPRGPAPDEASADSFPASDPPSSTGVVGPRRQQPERKGRSDDVATPHGPVPRREARPHGVPTTERHRTETAHHPEPTSQETEPPETEDK